MKITLKKWWIWQLLSLALLLSLLQGCQQLDPKRNPVISQQSAVQHQATLAKLQHWQVKGKIIVKSPQKKFSASLNWTQNNDKSDIRLTTFLGISIMKMINDRHSATLFSDGETHTSKNPQALLLAITGINLPINQLPQWIKGASTNNKQAKIIRDEWNRIKQISLQDGNKRHWQIDYSSYLQLGHQQLPQQVRLAGQDIAITIKISDWELL